MIDLAFVICSDLNLLAHFYLASLQTRDPLSDDVSSVFSGGNFHQGASRVDHLSFVVGLILVWNLAFRKDHPIAALDINSGISAQSDGLTL